MAVIWVFSWTEFERGWGQRPDGYSLHATESAGLEYLRSHLERQPKGAVPDEYDQADTDKPIAYEAHEALAYYLRQKDDGSLRLGRSDWVQSKTQTGTRKGELRAGALLASVEKLYLEAQAQSAIKKRQPKL